jgi:RNA recognition motif. (a.k.a. RRM, RBD, or RNP domain)
LLTSQYYTLLILQEAFVSYDRNTGRPRGFGFVVFADPLIADKVVTQQHTIDRREVEAKRALAKEESPVSKDQQAAATGQRTKKIFVGGLAATVDEEAFKNYFEDFGTVEDAVVMYDHDNRRPRGFGFITFTEEEAVDKVFDRGAMQTIHDKQIEIKRAVPRDSMSPSPQRSPMYRGPPPHYYDGRSPYGGGGGRYGPPPRYDNRGGYGTPHSGYGGGGRGRGDGSGRSPVMPGGGRGGPYTPPVVVTGIPASMAGIPGGAGGGDPAAGGGGMTQPSVSTAPGGDGGMGGVMGVPPQSPGPVTPGTMQGTPSGMVGGFSMQNGMSPGGGGGGGAPGVGGGGQYVGSPPPYALDPQQAAAAAHNLAELQQQVSLSSVTGALEQLQVQQQQPGQAQEGQAPGQQQQQPSTTIWS